MEKLEKIWWFGVAAAIAALVVFMVFIFKGNQDAATYSLMTAGLFSWGALGVRGLKNLRNHYWG